MAHTEALEEPKNGDIGVLGTLVGFVTPIVTVPVGLVHGAFISPWLDESLPHSGEEEEFMNVSLTSDIPESKYRFVLSKVADSYIAAMKIDASFTGLVAAWIDEGCRAWKKVVGLNKKHVWIKEDATAEPDIISLLVEELNSDRKLSSLDTEDDGVNNNTATGTSAGDLLNMKTSLRNLMNVKKQLEEKVFLDWHVISRFKGSQSAKVVIATGMPILTEAHTSAMAIVLKFQPSIYSLLQDRKTSRGYTLDNIIQCGLEIPNLPFGCAVGDDETYHYFKNFFVALIAEMKITNENSIIEHDAWLGHRGRFDLDPSHVTDAHLIDESYIVGSWMKGSRNIRGIPFPTFSNRYDRRHAEFILANSLKTFSQELSGKYVSANNITSDDASDLKDRKISFRKPSENTMLGVAGGGHDFPYGRGVFHDDLRTFLVWVNHEDHLRVDVKESGNVIRVFEKYCKIMNTLNSAIESQGSSFMRDFQFGYHTTCPSNLGTGVHIGALVKLPNMLNFLTSRNMLSSLNEIASKLGLTCTVKQTNDSSKQPIKVFELLTKYSMGYSEVELVQTIVDGLKTFISMEKCLEDGNIKGFSTQISLLPEKFLGPNIESEVVVNVHSFPTTLVRDDDLTLFRDDEAPFFSKAHTSLVAKACTPQIFTSIIHDSRGTAGWYTVSDAIRTAVDIPSTEVGILLAGEESFEAFAPLLIPVIRAHHNFDCGNNAHVNDHDLWQVVGSEAVDNVYIKSCVITSNRNIRGFAMCPAIDRKTRRTVENVMKTTFQYMSAQVGGGSKLKGKYHSLINLSESKLSQYRDLGVTVDKPAVGSRLHIGRVTRDWPDGRGFYRTGKKDITYLINEEDHVKLVVRNDSGNINMKTMIRDWEDASNQMEDSLRLCGYVFMHSANLGYLTTCPSNLGNAMRISVNVFLPHLSLEPAKIEEICAQKAINIANAESETGIHSWKLTNKENLGQSEVHVMQKMIDCLLNLIRIDKDSGRRQTVDELHYRVEVGKTPYPPKPEPVLFSQNNEAAGGGSPARGNSPTNLPSPIADTNDTAKSGAENLRSTSPSQNVSTSPFETAELKYIASFPVGSGVFKATRTTDLPVGSADKAAKICGCAGNTAFDGEWLGKKMSNEKAYVKRFLWIDPLTKTLHWSKVANKLGSSKCINLPDAKSIKSTDSVKRKSPDEIYFSIELKTGEVVDIQLPASMIKDIKKDWMKAIRGISKRE